MGQPCIMDAKLDNIASILQEISTKLEGIDERVKYLERTSKKLDTHTWVLERISVMMQSPLTLLNWSRGEQVILDAD